MATAPFKLLYVCNADTARSPLAAACTRRIGANGSDVSFDVGSAGTNAIDGDVARPEALVAAEALEIDLGRHRARALTVEHCLEPDLVLAMSWDQVSHIWSLVPEAWDKVFTIKEFVHWAKRAPLRPPILFPDRIAAMRDKIAQAHAVRKRARADYGFWGGIRPQDLNLMQPHGRGEDAWSALGHAVHALTSDVLLLLRGPENGERAARPASRRARSRR